jgi:hypothetical protein
MVPNAEVLDNPKLILVRGRVFLDACIFDAALRGMSVRNMVSNKYQSLNRPLMVP